ncbi:MAG: PASTA domain-containing protein [Elusimicrobiota bacterium]
MATTAKKSRLYIWEIGITLCVLLGLGIFMLQWGFEGIVHSRGIQVTPDLTGKSLSGALDLIAPLKLSIMKEGTEFNNTVAIGSILRQLPPAGTKVREGKAIRVVVSQGGATVFAPAIMGLPMRNAEMLLRQNQLTLGEVTESYSLRMDKGLVLSQDPRAETSVEQNSMVNVVVSAGKPPDDIRLVPDFMRKNVVEVSQWTSEKGVKLTIEKDKSSLFPYGTVLGQDPTADSIVSDDTHLMVTISGKPGGPKEKAGAVAFQYQVPQGSTESLVRIKLVDEHGERELFNGIKSPGSKIDLSVPEGRARVKIFLNNILVEERDL